MGISKELVKRVGRDVTTDNKPVLSVVKGNNAELINAAAVLYIRPKDIVLDCTYGKGKWWTIYKPTYLIMHDLILDGVDFRCLPEDDCSIDVVTFDPAYVAPGGRKTSTITKFNESYGLDTVPRTPAEADALIWLGMTEANRVLKPKGLMFVKCCNYISSGKFHQGHSWVLACADKLELTQVDEFILHSGTGPQPKNNLDGTPRRQVHSRRAHSFLVILQKKN